MRAESKDSRIAYLFCISGAQLICRCPQGVDVILTPFTVACACSRPADTGTSPDLQALARVRECRHCPNDLPYHRRPVARCQASTVLATAPAGGLSPSRRGSVGSGVDCLRPRCAKTSDAQPARENASVKRAAAHSRKQGSETALKAMAGPGDRGGSLKQRSATFSRLGDARRGLSTALTAAVALDKRSTIIRLQFACRMHRASSLACKLPRLSQLRGCCGLCVRLLSSRRLPFIHPSRAPFARRPAVA